MELGSACLDRVGYSHELSFKSRLQTLFLGADMGPIILSIYQIQSTCSCTYCTNANPGAYLSNPKPVKIICIVSSPRFCN